MPSPPTPDTSKEGESGAAAVKVTVSSSTKKVKMDACGDVEVGDESSFLLEVYTKYIHPWRCATLL